MMEQNLATMLREVSEFDRLHDVIRRDDDRRRPGHSYERASGS